MGTRVLYLVRHGQYHTAEDSPKYGQLTPLGRRQAQRVGKRLASVEFDVLHHSDMARAVETAALIARELPATLPTRSSRLLREGIPTAPVPGLPQHTRALYFVEQGARGRERCWSARSPNQFLGAERRRVRHFASLLAVRPSRRGGGAGKSRQ